MLMRGYDDDDDDYDGDRYNDDDAIDSRNC